MFHTSHEHPTKPVKSFYYLLLVGLSLAILMTANTAWGAKMTPSFVQTATIGNQFEISSSRLALENSQNDDVKGFAQQMINDHTEVGSNLKSVISNSDAKIPVPDAAMDPEHQKILNSLDKLKGTDFDREYLKAQVKSHDDAVALFKDYANDGDNPALKQFAINTLPTLQEHQEHAHAQSSLRGS